MRVTIVKVSHRDYAAVAPLAIITEGGAMAEHQVQGIVMDNGTRTRLSFLAAKWGLSRSATVRLLIEHAYLEDAKVQLSHGNPR